jgi:hypothetical protein
VAAYIRSLLGGWGGGERERENLVVFRLIATLCIGLLNNAIQYHVKNSNSSRVLYCRAVNSLS